MKYAVIRDERGNEVPLIFGNMFDTTKLAELGKVIAAGEAHVHQLAVTCDGYINIDGHEIGSRGLKDEILLRSSDFMGTIDDIEPIGPEE